MFVKVNSYKCNKENYVFYEETLINVEKIRAVYFTHDHYPYCYITLPDVEVLVKTEDFVKLIKPFMR